MSEIKRISEVLPQQKVYEAEKVDINALLNTEFIVLDYQILNGNYSEFAVILCSSVDKKKTFTFTTGSKVILKKLDTLKQNRLLPVIVKLVKIKRYYDFR